MKGIILAGGHSTRLHPVTRSISKQLLPVYDKPMVYYPLTTLMMAGVTQFLVITRPDESELFARLLGDGSSWGISIEYAVQDQPRGIADAFIVGERFIDGDPISLILGDNIFYGESLRQIICPADSKMEGARVFAYYVRDPERYGVVDFDANGHALGLEEKPAQPKSSYAITGLYFYDDQICDIVKGIEPSDRGEIEITSVNNAYLERGQLQVDILGRGVAWLDTGTHQDLLDANNFVATIENRQGLKIACPEEISFRLGLIDERQMLLLAEQMSNAEYSDYLVKLVQHNRRYLSL